MHSYDDTAQAHQQTGTGGRNARGFRWGNTAIGNDRNGRGFHVSVVTNQSLCESRR